MSLTKLGDWLVVLVPQLINEHDTTLDSSFRSPTRLNLDKLSSESGRITWKGEFTAQGWILAEMSVHTMEGEVWGEGWRSTRKD